MEPTPEPQVPDVGVTAPPPGWLQDLSRLGRAFKHLFGAQLKLLGAELGLARGAVSLLLGMALLATITGVGLGLTVLGLVGVALAQWLGSWIWALAVLCVLQALLLIVALLVFRRAMHWMSFPATRDEWQHMMRDTVRKARHQTQTEAEQT